MNTDEYKYRIAVSTDKIKINMNPNTLTDIMYFQCYLEGFSYRNDL